MQKVAKALAILMGLRDNILVKTGVDEIQHRKVHSNTHGKITLTLHRQ